MRRPKWPRARATPTPTRRMLARTSSRVSAIHAFEQPRDREQSGDDRTAVELELVEEPAALGCRGAEQLAPGTGAAQRRVGHGVPEGAALVVVEADPTGQGAQHPDGAEPEREPLLLRPLLTPLRHARHTASRPLRTPPAYDRLERPGGGASPAPGAGGAPRPVTSGASRGPRRPGGARPRPRAWRTSGGGSRRRGRWPGNRAPSTGRGTGGDPRADPSGCRRRR